MNAQLQTIVIRPIFGPFWESGDIIFIDTGVELEDKKIDGSSQYEEMNFALT
jgi:hypothetical protein